MSGLLDFPPSTLPPNALSHPYAVFAIRNVGVESALPKDIPLNAVLHFIPKLKECVLPVPSIGGLPKPLASVALRAPYVGINIESRDISVLGLKWVMKRLLQAAGRVHPRTLFLTQPSIGVAVAIYRTWMALELPAAGVANLVTHILTRLMMGPPVTIWEMSLIWESFPHDSDIVREMGMNSLRSHLKFNYSSSDTAALLDWYYVDRARRSFFHLIGHYFPGITLDREQAVREKINKDISKTKQKEIAEAARHDKGKRPEEQKTRDAAEKAKNLLKKDGRRKISPEEKHKRRKEDSKALKSRLRRTRSDDSIRSVETAIWDPEGSTETAGPLMPLSLSTQRALLSQAERNHEAAVSRRRRWKRTDSASILTAENLTEFSRMNQSEPRSVNETIKRCPTPPPRSLPLANWSSSSSTAKEEQDSDSTLSSARDLTRRRERKTVRKQSGREGMDEARRESEGSELPFQQPSGRALQTIQDANVRNLRRGVRLVLRTTESGVEDAAAGRAGADVEGTASDLEDLHMGSWSLSA